MFGSALLDVAIGLTLIFIVLSIVCSSIQEAIAGLCGRRAYYLSQAIRRMLAGSSRLSADAVLGHGLIAAVYNGSEESGSNQTSHSDRPSYIDPEIFGEVIVDLLRTASPDVPPRDVSELSSLRSAIVDATSEDGEQASNSRLSRALIGLAQSAADEVARADPSSATETESSLVEVFKAKVANWFDGMMQRAAGHYVRSVRVQMGIIAFIVVVLLNADAIQMARLVSANEDMRNAIVTCASEIEAPADAASYPNRLEALCPNTFQSFGAVLAGMPFGWPDGSLDVSWGDWLHRIIGWLIATAAIMLGAPFWFDLLGKVSRLRATGVRPPTANASPS